MMTKQMLTNHLKFDGLYIEEKWSPAAGGVVYTVRSRQRGWKRWGYRCVTAHEAQALMYGVVLGGGDRENGR